MGHGYDAGSGEWAQGLDRQDRCGSWPAPVPCPSWRGSPRPVRLSHGPARSCFGQRRLGRDNVPFEILKFRTMREGEGSDAERLTLLRSLPASHQPRRAAPALERPARRHEPRRPSPPARRSTSIATPPSRPRRHEVKPGLTGGHRSDGRNALVLGRSPGPGRLVRRPLVAGSRPPHPGPDPARVARAGAASRAPGSATMPEFRRRRGRGPHDIARGSPHDRSAASLHLRRGRTRQGRGGGGARPARGSDCVASSTTTGSRWGREWNGLPVLGGRDTLALLESDDAQVGLGIGGNTMRAPSWRRRSRLPRRASGHDRSPDRGGRARRGSRRGHATSAPLAVLHADAQVGRGCIVNSAAVVEHDCRLGDWVHVSPGAALGGGARSEKAPTSPWARSSCPDWRSAPGPRWERGP